jgi:RNA polymerase sigma-70 factor (ECF subfamily)
MKCVMHRTPGKRPLSAAQMSDEELLVSYRETRDRDLFMLLMQRYERELYSYLRRYLGNAEMAEDVFQTTFLQVHLKGDQFEEGRRFRPWVYTIATHQAIDAQRRNKRHRNVSLDAGHRVQDGDDSAKLMDLLISQDPNPFDSVAQMERAQWVEEALDKLTDPMRSVVNLVYYQGMKYREAAEVLSVPVGTVKSRLHAAILKLNEVWHRTHVP